MQSRAERQVSDVAGKVTRERSPDIGQAGVSRWRDVGFRGVSQLRDETIEAASLHSRIPAWLLGSQAVKCGESTFDFYAFHLDFLGALGGIRTPNLLIRSQML